MDELLEQFMIEGRELISKASDDLIALEEDATAPGRIESAFRAVHTLKGSVAIFDLGPMGVALHAAEDLLGSVRDAAVPMNVAVAQALLSCLDQCDRWMDGLEENGGLPAEASKDAVRIANGLLALSGASPESALAASPNDGQWVPELLQNLPSSVEEARSKGSDLVAIRYTPAEDCFFSGDDPIALVALVPELLTLEMRAREEWPPLECFDPYRCNLLIEMVTGASEPDVRQIFRYIPDQVEIVPIASPSAPGDMPGLSDSSGAQAQRTIRVDSLQIDRLLDLLGELIVSKNGLAHVADLAEQGTEPKATAAAIRAAQSASDRLIGDMHQALMSVRMVPLDRVFRRVTRIVRELSERLDRRVVLEVQGQQTRVDKAVADSLFEPLLHLVRNALDHGVEPPDTRKAVNKDPVGRVSLSARTLGDQILIEIADDGAGIDPVKVRQAAMERQIVPPERLQGMDDAATIQLIFAAGFSTSSAITDVSGRGVGLDAVKTAIERLGGHVAVASKANEGTSINLRLPATAALTTVLVVRVAKERFAVPLDILVQTVRVPRGSILPLGLGRAFVLRKQTLPLVELADLLGIDAGTGSGDAKVLVVDAGQGLLGIAVDDFSDRMDVMLRPMTGVLANVPGVSGTTLLGDGSVLLILNLAEVLA